jgi:hypothetical protein
METLFGLLVVGAIGYGVYALIRGTFGNVPIPHFQPPTPSAAEARRRVNIKRINQKFRKVQVDLINLSQAPDFRRAASTAAQSQEIPLAYRLRQFHRFRPRLVRHFADRLANGGDPAVLLESLQTLLQALGVAVFEADYIRTEAEGRLPANREHPVSYSAALLHLQREHQRRLEALRTLPGLDSETREQLIEAEKTRFREALENLGQQEPLPPGQTVGG